MFHADAVRQLPKPLINSVGHGDGTVLTSGTSDTHNQMILSLIQIKRNEELEHIFQLIKKNMGFLESEEICLDLSVVACQRSQIRIVLRVRKETDIK